MLSRTAGMVGSVASAAVGLVRTASGRIMGGVPPQQPAVVVQVQGGMPIGAVPVS